MRPDADPATGLEDLSLREAARLYAVELAALRAAVRRGEVDAFKASGPWGREWRVTRTALETAGYLPRTDGGAHGGDEHVAFLEAQLRSARRRAAAERSRADRADRRLGEALMESGRLRAALAAAQAGPADVAGPAVDMDELREVMLDLRVAQRRPRV